MSSFDNDHYLLTTTNTGIIDLFEVFNNHLTIIHRKFNDKKNIIKDWRNEMQKKI